MPRSKSARLLVEMLEDRTVPSLFVVNELADTHAVNLVSGMDAGGQVSLRSALEAANHLGGTQTIQFDPGVFAAPQTITLTLGSLMLQGPSTLTIQGPDAGVSISGNHASRVMRIAAGTHVSLMDLTIRDGVTAGIGGGIFNAGRLTISNSTISGNAAPTGQAAYLDGNTDAGGGIYNIGVLTVTNSTISGNSAAIGGGICNGFYGSAYGILSLTGCTISGNTASACGGAIDDPGTTTITGCTFADNTAAGAGGAIWETGHLTIRQSVVSANRAEVGGGVYIGNGTTTFNGSTISGNVADWNYGGGGGVYARGGTTVFDHCIISRNRSADSSGGGIDSAATVILRDSTISGNTAGSGGGIDNLGALYLDRCTLAGNSATQGVGGGICTGVPPTSYSSPDPVLTNCTISGNSASMEGGGIFVNAGDNVNLVNCTICGNTAATGGGIDTTYTATLTLSNSIVSGNTSQSLGGDLVGYVSSPSVHNLIGDGTGMTGIKNQTQGNLIGTHAAPINALLASLGDYGGPTQTMPPLLASPAINAGSNAAAAGLQIDQRGLPRIVGGTVDIGACELQITDGAAVVVPVVTQASTLVPATASVTPLVIHGSGFDARGTNTVQVTDQTHSGDKVTVGKVTVASATTLTITLSGRFSPGDVLAAVVTTDGACSASTAVATASQPPAIASAARATFTAGKFSSFTITTAGFPIAALSETGTLPAGLVWTDNGNGTATLSGTTVASFARHASYRFTIRASNGVGIAAVQSFQLFID